MSDSERARPAGESVENVADVAGGRARIHHRHAQHAAAVEIRRRDPAFARRL